MTATTAIITGTLTHEEKAVVDAYVEVVRTATDADLNAFAAYHRNKIDKAFANGGNTGAHVLLLGIVEDEQDRRYYGDAEKEWIAATDHPRTGGPDLTARSAQPTHRPRARRRAAGGTHPWVPHPEGRHDDHPPPVHPGPRLHATRSTMTRGPGRSPPRSAAPTASAGSLYAADKGRR